MSTPHPPRLARPAQHLLMMEMRAIPEFSAFLALAPALRLAPKGDGHPVLVIPGFMASDISTRPLRAFLRDRNYASHGWLQGTNLGPKPGVQDKLLERLNELFARHGQRKVSLVGWSLGGVLARELARTAPELVRDVITLGSPFAGTAESSNASGLYALIGGGQGDLAARARRLEPPPVPSTAIYTRTDGVVAWQSCLERASPTTENIEVEGSHSGLGHNPAVLYVVADRLAQPEGQWKPFHREGLRALIYPAPGRGAASAA